MNGHNLTERFRKILVLAREDAIARRHEYIGAEHLLLGLIAEGEGVGVAALQRVGVDVGAVKARVEAVLPQGNASSTVGPGLPYTSRAKQVIEFAMVEALECNHSYVSSEHLLLGLLREQHGIAAQVLTASGALIEVVRKETLRLLGTDAAQEQITVPNGNIASIAIEVRFADESRVRRDFRNVADALHFLKQTAHDAARRGDG